MVLQGHMTNKNHYISKSAYDRQTWQDDDLPW